MKIQFYPLDFTYKVVDCIPELRIFGKTVSTDPICIIDRSFLPYFYLVLNDKISQDDFIAEFKGKMINNAEITAIQKAEKNYLDKPIQTLKIFAKTPKQLPAIVQFFKDFKGTKFLFESDLRYVNRYILDKRLTPLCLTEVEGEFIDRPLKSPAFMITSIRQISDDTIKDLRIMAIDIETYSPWGKAILPEKNPILMVAFACSDFKKVLCWKRFKTDLEYVEFVDSEASLLERFKEIINNYRPDILTGYFSDGFDLPYIKVRAEKYAIDLNIGLDHSAIKVGKGMNRIARITGMVHIDIFKFIRKVMFRSLETDTFSLNEVSKEILGEQKHDVNIDELSDKWDNNPKELEKFCEYNLQDAQLTLQLLNKLFPNIEEIVKITGSSLFRGTRMSFSQLVENFIMKRAIDYDELIPNKPHYALIRERLHATYQGASVYEPSPGLYKNIAVIDFRSFWPSIIISHNISPSTMGCECCVDSKNKIDLENKQYRFCEKKKGFISAILEEIITRRMRIKEILKDAEPDKRLLLSARSEALKILSNSFYGYMAFSPARWYCLECAESTTAFGRKYIKDVMAKAEEKGFGILYSDNDSVFMLLKDKPKQAAKDFCAEINKTLPSLMELNYENYFPAGLFVSVKKGMYGAKKRYAMVDEQGVIKVKGFESVRRNTSLIAKDAQEKIFHMILVEEDAGKAFDYVKQVIADLVNKKIPKEKVVIFTQLQKKISSYKSISPHVAAALRMLEKGYDVGPGTLVKYIVVSGQGRIRDRARLVEEVKQDDYDAEYYINNQLIPAVDKIFEVLGYDVNKLLGERSQSKLDRFG